MSWLWLANQIAIFVDSRIAGFSVKVVLWCAHFKFPPFDIQSTVFLVWLWSLWLEYPLLLMTILCPGVIDHSNPYLNLCSLWTDSELLGEVTGCRRTSLTSLQWFAALASSTLASLTNLMTVAFLSMLAFVHHYFCFDYLRSYFVHSFSFSRTGVLDSCHFGFGLVLPLLTKDFKFLHKMSAWWKRVRVVLSNDFLISLCDLIGCWWRLEIRANQIARMFPTSPKICKQASWIFL